MTRCFPLASRRRGCKRPRPARLQVGARPQGILVTRPHLHDDREVGVRVGHQIKVLRRVVVVGSPSTSSKPAWAPFWMTPRAPEQGWRGPDLFRMNSILGGGQFQRLRRRIPALPMGQPPALLFRGPCVEQDVGASADRYAVLDGQRVGGVPRKKAEAFPEGLVSDIPPPPLTLADIGRGMQTNIAAQMVAQTVSRGVRRMFSPGERRAQIGDAHRQCAMARNQGLKAGQGAIVRVVQRHDITRTAQGSTLLWGN
jgi:hypothetical protein